MGRKKTVWKREPQHRPNETFIGFWVKDDCARVLKGIASILCTDISGLFRQMIQAMLHLSQLPITPKELADLRDLVRHYGMTELVSQLRDTLSNMMHNMPSGSITTEIADMFADYEETPEHPHIEGRRTQRGKHQNWVTQEILTNAKHRAGHYDNNTDNSTDTD